MPININSQSPSQTTQASHDVQQSAKLKNGTGIASTSDSLLAESKVNLSDDATLLSKLEQKISSLPVTDASRIEQLKTDIANGQYKSDFLVVAQKLIDSNQGDY